MVLLEHELTYYGVVIFMALLAYALLTLDEVAVRLEQPFGFDSTDLPLGEYCNIVRENVDVTRNSDLELVHNTLMATVEQGCTPDLTEVVSDVQANQAAYLRTLAPLRGPSMKNGSQQ